jgi:GDP-4-dehydro-6-deoxy-D-mannose reductase
MRAFVTGGHGFVGPWLRAHLEEAGDEVVAPPDGFEITDPDAVSRAVSGAAPDAIYHLAAISNVVQSWQAPAHTFEVNALGTLHLLEAARALPAPPRILLIGSAEVYGKVRPDQVPITETTPLRPVTPYAVSKVAAEFLGMQAHLAYGLPVLSARAFNHIGPSQAGGFVVADLARRIVEAHRDGTKTLKVGNLSVSRDFTDVRDVVRAYRLLIERGEAGEAYNVCSGRDIAIHELADRLLALSGADLTLEVDPDLVRAVDLPVLRGDPSKTEAATGWRPRIPLDQTLTDVLTHTR